MLKEEIFYTFNEFKRRCQELESMGIYYEWETCDIPDEFNDLWLAYVITYEKL